MLEINLRQFSLLLCFFCILNRVNSALPKEPTWRFDLPPSHVAFYFNGNPRMAARCRHDSHCPFKMHLDRNACWGYEKNCTRQWQYSYPSCLEDHQGWIKTKAEQEETFYKQGDFGYIKERLAEMFPVCQPLNKGKSSLMCTKHLRYCRGQHIFFNFTSLKDLPEPMRYRMDVIREHQVGGNCYVNNQRLQQELDHMSPLQSWSPELKHFTQLQSDLDEICDIVVKEPTFILKLDATVNMYHHFCDFFNLYASLHMNNTFTTNIRILIWDTMSYRSNFESTWKAFTRHPIQDLKKYEGKTVCFHDIVLPLLPRMIFGMYYNMPLIPGCEGSGLFHAFRHHVVFRLGIKEEIPSHKKLRVTLLARSTTYRQILNQDQLIKALRDKKEFEIRKVDFNWKIPFEEQLQVTCNTDILIGIHGAGLTHMLFLPDWAAVFEIYHCEDPGCYHDLARLRGVRYFTWEKQNKLKQQDEGHHPTEGAHAKFTNYEFDVAEFLRIIRKAAQHVRNHPQWRNLHQPDQSSYHTEL